LYEMKVMRGVMTRMLQMAMSKSFNQWRNEAMKMSRSMGLLKRTLMKLTQRSKAMAFTKWKEAMAEMRASFLLVKHALMKMMHGQLSKAFGQWREISSELVHQRRILKAAVMRLSKRSLSMAWYTWRSSTVSMNDNVLAMRRVVLRMMSYSTARALSHWRSIAAGEGTFDKASRNALVRLSQNHLSMTFNTWRATANFELADQESHNSATAYHASLVKLKKRKAWTFWTANLSDDLRNQSRMRRAMYAMTHRGMLSALKTWVEKSEDKRMKTLVMLKSARYMARRKVAGAYNKWVNDSLTRLSLDTKSEAALRIILGNNMRSKFDFWRTLSGVKTMEHDKMSNAVGKTVRKWRNKQLRTGFITLLRHATFEEDSIAAQARAGRAFIYRGVKRAFNHWVASTLNELHESDWDRAALRKWYYKTTYVAFAMLRSSARRATSDMKHQDIFNAMRTKYVARAFFTWCSAATESVLEVEVMRRAVKNFGMSKLVSSFYKWQAAASDSSRVKIDNAKAHQYNSLVFTQNSLRMSWNYWLDMGRSHLSLIIATENLQIASKMRLWRRWVMFKTQHPHSDTAMRVKVINKMMVTRSRFKWVHTALFFSHWKILILKVRDNTLASDLAK